MPRIAPRVCAGALSSPGGWGRRLLHRRQRPAVASELTRHGDGHDRAPLATALERVPALVQTARTGIGTRSYRCRLPLPPPLERGARAYGPALVPGGLDEQASRVRIARLRDRALAASLAVGVLEGKGERPARKALTAEPGVVRERPRARLVHEPVAQEQLREPVPGAHQVAACVLAGANEIARRLLVGIRHPHRDEIAQA